MRLLTYFVIFALFLLGALFMARVFFTKNTFTTFGARVTIGKSSYEVEVVRTLTQKAKGLAGRSSLAPGAGMLFLFDNQSHLAFTMHGMRFPLDIIWIANGVIVDISKNLLPDTGLAMSSYRPKMPADTVLELNAGVADADGLKIGDSVIIEYK